MPAEIPEIQLDDNWLEDVEMNVNNETLKNLSAAGDELTVADAERRTVVRSNVEIKKSNLIFLYFYKWQ